MGGNVLPEQKARLIVTEKYEIRRESRHPVDYVLSAAQEAATSSKGSIGAGIERIRDEQLPGGGERVFFAVVGLGSLARLMDFSVSATPAADGGSTTTLTVGNFLFETWAPWAKPTINAHPIMTKFVDHFQESIKE